MKEKSERVFKKSTIRFVHAWHRRFLLPISLPISAFLVFTQMACQPSNRPTEVAEGDQEFAHQKLTSDDLKGPVTPFGGTWKASECTITVASRFYPCLLTLSVHQDNPLAMIFVEGTYSIFNSQRQFILPGATVRENFLIDAADPTYKVGKIGSRGASYRYENGDRYYFKQVSSSELAFAYLQSDTYKLETTLHLGSTD